MDSIDAVPAKFRAISELAWVDTATLFLGMSSVTPPNIQVILYPIYEGAKHQSHDFDTAEDFHKWADGLLARDGDILYRKFSLVSDGGLKEPLPVAQEQ